MIGREGAEIAIFSFTGKYTLPSISAGIAIALVAALLIYFSLVKVNLKVLFSITLIYLILQAGFLLGYGIHEGLSALKALGKLPEDSILLAKAFNLSKTALNHKEGVIGLPLYVLFGWYSKPEWIQFITQYAYTIGIFALWFKKIRPTAK
jgi:high-affinity iron transporter